MNTIAAIVTSLGKSAVSIIRVSGSLSFPVAQKLTETVFEDHHVTLAWIKDPTSSQNVDQVIILPFRSPRSYTGEDIVEIHSHGGLWVVDKILSLLLEEGIHLAKPGEFTERAFLNGKIDLSQAESIMDLIEARSASSGNNAIKIYQGYLGKEILELRQKLLALLGDLTAAIDFPDEVSSYEPSRFQLELQFVIEGISKLLETEKEGHILRSGYKVAIVGNPNVGKSTLLNTLLSKERAIVTDIPGTTRDLIEESYSLNGIPIVLLDTAGIRQSDDKVEQIGIQKTIEAIHEADLILHLKDLSSEEASMIDFDSMLENKDCISIGTKLDLCLNDNLMDTQIQISSKNNINIDQLKQMISSRIIGDQKQDFSIKINHRQADILRKAKSSLEHSLEASSESIDFWTIDLRQAILYLGEITGETLSEELLDNIFARFCIGK